MDPTRISDTIQAFRGVRYYRCGPYFQRNGRMLHLDVWTAAHGEIPPGSHIHHVNHDKHDNRLANLALLPAGEHLRHHASRPSERQREARGRNARSFATEGNKRISTERRGDAARRGWDTVQLARVACTECGTPVETPFPSRTKFCGGTCKARALRRRRREARASG